MKKKILVKGPVLSQSGYGEQAGFALRALKCREDLFDIYNACPIDSRYKYIQSLNDSADRLLLNAELMDLESYCEQALLEANMNLEVLSSKIHGYLDENRN